MADKRLRRVMHGGGVERMQHMPGAIAVERERAAARDDAVEIMPRGRRETGIETVRHQLAGKHAYGIGPELRVQRVAHLVSPPVLGEVEMRHLA